MLLRQGLGLASLGAALGLPAALGLSRFLRGLLNSVSPVDAATYAAGGASLLAVAALASFLPARRAMRADPISALREE
jgi:ABC-type antimicrobial peptide transport system permease subunit